jgi:hypothetical protein
MASRLRIMTDEDFSDTDVPKDFSIISWFMSIPLCDDVWLGMQAQHIAAVEIGIRDELLE